MGHAWATSPDRNGYALVARMPVRALAVAPVIQPVLAPIPVPVLERLLVLFAARGGLDWATCASVPGLDWRDVAPVEDVEPDDPQINLSRSGTLLLAGFGDTWLPDGEGDVREGNEGESGVTLLGSASRVEAVAVVKCYPSEDIATILRRQCPSAMVEPLAPGAAGDRGLSFLIRLRGCVPLRADVFVDEEGGSSSPGSTTFLFHRSAPDDEPGGKIAEMRCREG
ncbi:hypothetical protein [Lysobacter hankyongensis]